MSVTIQAALMEQGVEIVPIGSLHFFPGNARRGNIEKLRESIRDHGQYKPVQARRAPYKGVENVVIVGNHTMQAMREEDASHIAVTWIDCSDEEAVEINLIDNKLSDEATYDDDALREQLEALGELSRAGYSEAELDDLRTRLEPPSLDDLEEEWGEYDEEQGWPRISLKVAPEVKEKFDLTLSLCDGENDSQKLAQLCDYATESMG